MSAWNLKMRTKWTNFASDGVQLMRDAILALIPFSSEDALTSHQGRAERAEEGEVKYTEKDVLALVEALRRSAKVVYAGNDPCWCQDREYHEKYGNA